MLKTLTSRILTDYPVEAYLQAREDERPPPQYVATWGVFGPPIQVVCVTDFPPLLRHRGSPQQRTARVEQTFNHRIPRPRDQPDRDGLADRHHRNQRSFGRNSLALRRRHRIQSSGPRNAVSIQRRRCRETFNHLYGNPGSDLSQTIKPSANRCRPLSRAIVAMMLDKFDDRSYSAGVSAGGSHAPVVKSSWRTSSLSRLHLVAVSR